MRQAIVLLFGLLLVVGIGVTAAHRPLPESVGGYGGVAARIETNLQASVDAALAATPFDWARATMDGQVAIVSGTAPRDEERSQALAIVASAAGDGGFLRGGIIQVVDRTELAAPIRPYEWSARRDGLAVAITGAAPSRALKGELEAYASTLFPGGVRNELIIARGAADEAAFAAATRTILAQLALINEGRAHIKDNLVRVDGIASSVSARTQVRAALSGLPAPYRVVDRLDVSDAGGPGEGDAGDAGGPEPETGVIDDVAVCQDMFDQLMSEGRVSFGDASSTLEKESYPVLDRLAEAAVRCRRAGVTITGHTDNTGDPGANQRLSERRAQAVADYFILKGVASDRLTVVGLGDAEPIADNDTDEGRALNRRIAFNLSQ